jgi:hypothetical protein
MKDRHIEDRVRAHQWPEMSPDVRQRVMSSPFAPVEPVTWSDRVWFSPAWRFAAAAAVVVVIALDQLTGVTFRATTPSPQVMAEAQAIQDVATEAGLPVQTAAWLADRALFDASQLSAAPEPGAALFQALELETTGGM